MSGFVARRGPGRPPGADGAETRLQILRSARQVFSTIGFDRASLKQIAEDAGFTRNAIANYYPNKIELYRAAIRIDQTFVRFFVTSRPDAIHHPDLREQAMAPIGLVRKHFGEVLAAARRDGTRRCRRAHLMVAPASMGSETPVM